MTEDEVVGWHHRLNGHEFEWTLGVGDGQGGLACYSPWDCNYSDMTECLNWTGHLGCILSPAYLTSRQSTSSEMPGWMNQDCWEKYQ